MSKTIKRNLPASVRQRLLTLSRNRQEPFNATLVRYAIERLLYRLSMSPYADRFLLKGAMLFAIWSETLHRPTQDVDLLGYGNRQKSGLFRSVPGKDLFEVPHGMAPPAQLDVGQCWNNTVAQAVRDQVIPFLFTLPGAEGCAGDL